MFVLRCVLVFLCFVGNSLADGTQCLSCADITFLLDESTSVDDAEFDQQQQFVIDIVNQFSDFGPTGIQISVALFASDARNAFYLNEYTTKAEIIEAISNITEGLGNSGIGTGLKFVRENNFAPENGADRENCQKFLIVIADGPKTVGVDVFPEEAKLKAMDVCIIAVGVGSNSILSNELKLMSSRTDLAFDLGSFNNLNANTQNVADKICEPKPEQCVTCADIVFLLDESTSVGGVEFKQFQDFIATVMTSFSTFGQPLGVQFGMTCFATSPRNHFFLNEFDNKIDTVNALLSIQRIFGSTATGEALKLVRETQFTEEKGANRTCPKLLIVLLDGEQNTGSAIIAEESQLLRDMGVINFAVGVLGASTTELEQIASFSPDNSVQYVYDLESFDDLKLSVGSIIQSLCEAATVPARTTSPSTSTTTISTTTSPHITTTPTPATTRPHRHRCKHHRVPLF